MAMASSSQSSSGPRLRIAHVSDCFAPRTGGIETQVAALARKQRDAGHSVRIITATPGSGDAGTGLEVQRITAPMPMDLPVHPRTRSHVVSALQRDPVDVVHVHAGVVSPFAWGAVRAVHQLGLPALVTVHCVWGPLARPTFAASDALLRWSAWGIQVAAVSEMAAAVVASAVPRLAPVLVTPNGIDPAQWTVTPQGSAPGVLRVVSVSRLAPRKRIAALLSVWARAARRLEAVGVRLLPTLVGDGPLRDRAQRQADRLGLRVEFTGRLDPAGIREVLGRCDVFVQASVRESFGLAALEARTSGVPVIARSQSGSTAFITDGLEGLLAEDDSALVEAIVRLGCDPALLATLTAHDRQVEPAQAWPQVLARVDDAYAQAITRRAGVA